MWSVDYSLIEAWLDEQDEETVAGIFAAVEGAGSRAASRGCRQGLVAQEHEGAQARFRRSIRGSDPLRLRPGEEGRHALGWRQVQGKELPVEVGRMVPQGHTLGRAKVRMASRPARRASWASSGPILRSEG